MKVRKTITIDRAVCEAIERSCGPKEFSERVNAMLMEGLGMSAESGDVGARIAELEELVYELCKHTKYAAVLDGPKVSLADGTVVRGVSKGIPTSDTDGLVNIEDLIVEECDY